MNEAQPRASFGLFQGESDDGVERRPIPGIGLVSALPGIDEPLVRDDFQNLAPDRPVPFPGRRGAIGEAVAHHGRETRRRHVQPAAHQFAGGECLPDRLRRVWEDLIDHDLLRAGRRRRARHVSISLSRVRRLANRSRQKAS